jgi:hypothetical protein
VIGPVEKERKIIVGNIRRRELTRARQQNREHREKNDPGVLVERSISTVHGGGEAP